MKDFKEIQDISSKNKKPKKQHDKPLFRLINILNLLMQDTKPTIQELSDEFNISPRSIQKDVYESLSSFSIVKDSLGRLIFENSFDIKKAFFQIEEIYFLSLSLSQLEDIDKQHQKLAQGIFRKILKKKLYNPYFIKAEIFQPIDDDEELIDDLKLAITNTRAISIVFNHKVLKLFPYKIASFEGIWYLMADDVREDKLKIYMISRIEDLVVLKENFERMPELEKVLDEVESSWYVEGNSFDIVVKVYKEIAEYFRLKKHLLSQEILEELPDGSLIVKFTVTHDEDVDNLIKSWLPHIEVISPDHFKNRIIKELSDYLQKIT